MGVGRSGVPPSTGAVRLPCSARASASTGAVRVRLFRARTRPPVPCASAGAVVPCACVRVRRHTSACACVPYACARVHRCCARGRIRWCCALACESLAGSSHSCWRLHHLSWRQWPTISPGGGFAPPTPSAPPARRPDAVKVGCACCLLRRTRCARGAMASISCRYLIFWA